MAQTSIRPLAFILGALLCSSLLIACGEQFEATQASGSKTDDTPEEAKAIDETGRFKYFNTSVPLKKDWGDEAESKFVYVASLDAPVEEESGEAVQATSFFLEGRHAYVSYNMAGASLGGGIELINLDNPKRPLVEKSFITNDIEFADLVVYKDHIYAVGADENGAVLAVFDEKLNEQSRIPLDAYYANSISLQAKNLYVSAGDNLGIVQFWILNRSRPTRVSSYPLKASTHVQPWRHSFLAFGRGSLYRADHWGELEELVELSKESFEAPARFRVDGNTLVTNAVGSQLLVFDLKKAEKKEVELVAKERLPGTGNGLDLYKKSLFLAQGDAGVHYYELRHKNKLRYKGQFDFKDDRGSANNVRVGKIKSGEFIFSADGLGGLRILKWDD